MRRTATRNYPWPVPIAITDHADPRLEDYVSLTDVALRRRAEPERGLYIAESEKVIRRALTAGHQPRSFLMAQRWLADLADVVGDAEAQGIPVFVGEHDVIERLTGFHLHRGALASMQRPRLPDVAGLVVGARRVMVLEDIVDHTNVGAIFRSAAGLGVDAVLVTPRCADPLYRRSIRVSMGTVFQVPWTRIDPWPGGVDVLRQLGLTVAAMALSEGRRDPRRVRGTPPGEDRHGPRHRGRRDRGAHRGSRRCDGPHSHGRRRGLTQRRCCLGGGDVGATRG